MKTIARIIGIIPGMNQVTLQLDGIHPWIDLGDTIEVRRIEAEGIRPGDVVKLKPETYIGKIPEGRQNFPTATVFGRLEGGGLFLSRDIGGMRYWNETDVEVVK